MRVPPILISFCANGRRAGKDTAANYVEEWCGIYGLSCARLAFADSGKQLIAKSLAIEGLPSVDRFKEDGGISVETSEGNGHHLTGRDFIINLLNGARDLFGDDFWTDVILPPVWLPTADVTVITDLRFPSETDRILSLGGRIYEIYRDTAEDGQSEGELLWAGDRARIWKRLLNNGSLDDLRTLVFSQMTGLVAEPRHG